MFTITLQIPRIPASHAQRVHTSQLVEAQLSAENAKMATPQQTMAPYNPQTVSVSIGNYVICSHSIIL